MESPPEKIKQLIKDGHYADAEAASRAFLGEVEARNGPDSLDTARVLDLLVESLWRGGKARAPETRGFGERAVAIKERTLGAESPEVAVSLNQLGHVLLLGGDYGGAKPLYERALAIREKTLGADDPAVAESVNSLGNFYSHLDNYPAAIPLFERALTIYEKVRGPNHSDVARELNNLADVLLRAGDYNKARPLEERAVGIWEKSLGPEHPFVAQGLTNLANLDMLTGDFAGAKPFFERALAINEKTLGPDHPSVAESMGSLANLLRVTGDLQGTKAMFERALAILEKTLGPEHPSLAGHMVNFASLLKESGDYAGARRLYERALAIQEKALGPDALDVAHSLAGLGDLLRQMGDYTDAKVLQERALAIFEKTLGPDHINVAICLGNLGILHRLTGDFPGAKQLYERALAIKEKALGPEHPSLSYTLVNLGKLHEVLEDYSGAIALYERALKIDEKKFGPDHLRVGKDLESLALVHLVTHDPAKAKPLYERALSIREKALGPGHPNLTGTLRGLAEVYWHLSDRKSAFEAALRAQEIERAHLVLTARTLSERQALAYESVRQYSLSMLLSFQSMALDQSEESKRAVWSAVIRSRALVLDEMAGRHRSLAETTNPEVALLAARHSSASQRLTTLLTRGPGNSSAERYQKLLEGARQEEENGEQALAEKSAEFREKQARNRLGLEEVAAALPADSALVAFVRYAPVQKDWDQNPKPGGYKVAPAYLAFVLRAGKSGPIVMPFGKGEDVDALVTRWRGEVAKEAMAPGHDSKRSEISYRAAGEDLRRKLWDPLVVPLQNAKRVFIVPDGSLHLVNFAAFPVGQDHYLIETGPMIHYLSAERDLVPFETKTQGKGLLALGNPAFDEPSLFAGMRNEPKTPNKISPDGAAQAQSFRGNRSACGDFRTARFEALPGSGSELNQVANLWRESDAARGKNNGVVRLAGAQANEAEFKRLSPGKRVLHLATHGFFLDGRCASALEPNSLRSGEDEPGPAKGENPLLLSGLALAGANHRDAAGPNEEDGILTAEEIGALDLDGVEWAVLSACDTGVGEVKAGEGVLGLRRSFQVAGVRTVIMSLWPVEDKAASLWMSSLYKQRFQRGLSTVESVHQASLEVLRQRRAKHVSTHPFYWAAFVAAGDWR